MKLRCCDFIELSNRIKKREKKVVLFGAGAIGRVVTPALLSQLDLINYVECYVDNDNSKWGSAVKISGKDINIYSPDYLKSCDSSTIILLNISRYADVIKQLERYPNVSECYIMPMMLIHNFCQGKSGGEYIVSDTPLIPKKLHYMWLGKNPIPNKLKRCIESWKKYCPDYEIIKWNENNYDISKNEYMQQAYECGAYGFVPDYARLDILYNEGGIYLDVDVEIKRNIDHLLYQNAFCGVEKWQILNFGGMSGAVKNNPSIKAFMVARDKIKFLDKNGKQNRNTCGFYDTAAALEMGYIINGKSQVINDMNIYAYDFFHSYDYMSGLNNVTDNTYSTHWFNGGWLDEDMIIANRETVAKYMDFYMAAIKNSSIDG